MKQEAIRSRDSGNVCTGNFDENVKSFMGFVQLSSEEMKKILNSTTLVAYAVRAVPLKLSPRRKQSLIGIGNTPAQFRRVCFAKEQLKEEGSLEDEEIFVQLLT